MRTFTYKLKDDMGRPLYGVMEAVNKKDVQRKLSSSKYFFISALPCNKKKLFESKAKLQVLIMFTQRLTSLIESGVPILSSMDILWRQTEDPAIQKVISHMKIQIEEGNRISDSLDAFPNMFPPVYRAIFRVGEMSGSLVMILKKLCQYLEYRAYVIEKTKRATLYPSIVLGFSVLVIIGLFVFLVPIFEKVLTKLDVKLPWLTKTIINISSVIRNPIFVIAFFMGVIIIFFLYKYFIKKTKLAKYFDEEILRIPFFGNLIRLSALSQFVRSLSILLASGLPILESIIVANTTSGNKKISSDIDQIRVDIEQGTSLYEGFRKVKGLPVMMVEMVGVGETSGKIVDTLERVTTYFDAEVDYQMNKFLTMLEPGLIIFVGFAVLITLLAIYMPVLSIWQGLLK